MSFARVLARLAATRSAGPLRRGANALLGPRLRVVRVRSGIARGARLELDLTREKAYWLGHYEPSVQNALADSVKAGDVVYDVGAHIGFFSIGAARLGARVFAFEPSPENAARLRRNVQLNAADVDVVEAAAWDRDDGVQLVAGGSDSEWRAQEGGPVESLTLDRFALSHPAPSLVKIDAEGAEARVLRGARELLRTSRPMIVCELHDAAARAEIERILEGYRFESLGGPTHILALPDAPWRSD